MNELKEKLKTRAANYCLERNAVRKRMEKADILSLEYRQAKIEYAALVVRINEIWLTINLIDAIKNKTL